MSRRTEKIYKLEKEIRALINEAWREDAGGKFLIQQQINEKKAELDNLKKGLN